MILVFVVFKFLSDDYFASCHDKVSFRVDAKMRKTPSLHQFVDIMISLLLLMSTMSLTQHILLLMSIQHQLKGRQQMMISFDWSSLVNMHFYALYKSPPIMQHASGHIFPYFTYVKRMLTWLLFLRLVNQLAVHELEKRKGLLQASQIQRWINLITVIKTSLV